MSSTPANLQIEPVLGLKALYPAELAGFGPSGVDRYLGHSPVRLYVLALQPTLFDEITLVRSPGRIGTAGQGMQETFDGIAEARRDFDRLAGQKTSKGYR